MSTLAQGQISKVVCSFIWYWYEFDWMFLKMWFKYVSTQLISVATGQEKYLMTFEDFYKYFEGQNEKSKVCFSFFLM